MKQRIKNVPVRFLSVIDPIQFGASSPEMLYKTVGCCVKRYQVIWAGKKTKGLKAKAFNDRPNPTIKCPADPTTLDTTTFLTRDHIDVGWDDPVFKYIKKAFKAVAPDSI
ncbi:MAG: hypothetical protein CUN57_01300 [Phototrophicales bacterium]|nr:MAG: hypothetical protein CUN57_01300 [Phototrophicales bacterium]